MNGSYIELQFDVTQEKTVRLSEKIAVCLVNLGSLARPIENFSSVAENILEVSIFHVSEFEEIAFDQPLIEKNVYLSRLMKIEDRPGRENEFRKKTHRGTIHVMISFLMISGMLSIKKLLLESDQKFFMEKSDRCILHREGGADAKITTNDFCWYVPYHRASIREE